MSTEGDRRKAEGVERALVNPMSAPWKAVAMAELRRLAVSGDLFTSEDMTAVVGQPPSSSAVGAVMNAASRGGWIVRVGFDKAERANQHSALISQWRGIPGRIPMVECSCGRGPVGHTSDHESTETRGIVRIVRAGKTDQYLDYRRMEADAADGKRKESAAAEERRLRNTPRVDPRSHRLSLGGPLPCEKCGATGGSLWESCVYCDGRGLR